MNDIKKYLTLLDSVMSEQSVFLGDQHTAEFWSHNYKALISFKPDYLLLEVIGKHRYMNKREREKAKRSNVYLSNSANPGYNSDAFRLADDLDVPMIGIDTWTHPYMFPRHWDKKDRETNCEYSHRIRESNMVEVAKEFLPKGKVLLIVGAEHLRDDSELTILAKREKCRYSIF